MIYSEFKTLILSKTQNRKEIPPDSNIDYKVWTALKMISKHTVPLKLVVNDPSTYSIYRRVDENTYIRLPNRPVDESDSIDIDDVLLDAAALYVAAGLEAPKAPVHMGFYREEIDLNNERLIETALCFGSGEGDYDDTTNKFV